MFFYHPIPEAVKPLIPKLRKQQDLLRTQIRLQPLQQQIQFIAGCDSAFIGDDIFSVFVIFSYPDLHEIEIQTARSPVSLPYIPGLLAFREIPNLLKTYALLKQRPDIILVDGHGIMHPKRLGIATHLGITLDMPTIGVAKKKLFGTYLGPENKKGAYTTVFSSDEPLGYALRSKENVKEIFVSPGHLCTMEDALTLVSKCVRRHKLPEPTRIADLYSKTLKITT